MKVGSFIPERSAPTLYAMAGDDCSLHHDLSSLTPKQRVDHQENQVLTCALQVALVGLGKTSDHVALGTPFTDPAWREIFVTTVRCSPPWALIRCLTASGSSTP